MAVIMPDSNESRNENLNSLVGREILFEFVDFFSTCWFAEISFARWACRFYDAIICIKVITPRINCKSPNCTMSVSSSSKTEGGIEVTSRPPIKERDRALLVPDVSTDLYYYSFPNWVICDYLPNVSIMKWKKREPNLIIKSALHLPTRLLGWFLHSHGFSSQRGSNSGKITTLPCASNS